MKTAICVMIKDENDYLDEWLSYHLNLGIDEIFLYEDRDSKSHLDIVKPYGDRVHLNSIDVIFDSKRYNKNNRFQLILFNYFPEMYRDKFDWILFIDLDEFLILKKPLHELLKEYDDKSGILFKWKFYGASGHVNKPTGKVMDNFTKHVITTHSWGWNCKSFINCKNFKRWKKEIHEVDGGVYPLTESGFHKGWINHYFTKSWEEWKTKILERGDAYPGNRKIFEFFEINKDMLPLKEQLMSEITEQYKNEKKK